MFCFQEERRWGEEEVRRKGGRGGEEGNVRRWGGEVWLMTHCVLVYRQNQTAKLVVFFGLLPFKASFSSLSVHQLRLLLFHLSRTSNVIFSSSPGSVFAQQIHSKDSQLNPWSVGPNKTLRYKDGISEHWLLIRVHSTKLFALKDAAKMLGSARILK